MLDARDQQLTISKDLNLRLQSDLKKSRSQTKLVGSVGLISVIGVIFILK